MSAISPLRTAEGCLRRALAIKGTAKRLVSDGDEWFAVCYFYAAYHTVKAAFIEDPIFDDLKALSLKNSYLILDDRFASSHHGRVNNNKSRRMGVNDIVTVLYPDIAAEYVRLHMASIAVRYGEGLSAIAPSSTRDDYEAVISAYQEGRLRA